MFFFQKKPTASLLLQFAFMTLFLAGCVTTYKISIDPQLPATQLESGQGQTVNVVVLDAREDKRIYYTDTIIVLEPTRSPYAIFKDAFSRVLIANGYDVVENGALKLEVTITQYDVRWNSEWFMKFKANTQIVAKLVDTTTNTLLAEKTIQQQLQHEVEAISFDLKVEKVAEDMLAQSVTEAVNKIFADNALASALMSGPIPPHVYAANSTPPPPPSQTLSPENMRKTALVIGNGAYRNGALRNPVNDATDVAQRLEQAGFNVILLKNANQRLMDDGVNQLWASLRKGGVGMFYYAGHAMQVAGRNYLIPIGANVRTESDIRYETIDVGRVLGKMEDAGNNLNIVVLDACRNNPFARSFRSASRGLAAIDAPRGSLVAYSTSPGDVAEDGSGRNGTYTKHLLRHLLTPGITIEEVLKRVRIDVSHETSGRQTPWESSSLTGYFYFKQGE